FEDCIPFSGDSLTISPTFKENKIEQLIGKSVHIEIECRTAILFAMEGDFRPHHGMQPQDMLGSPRPSEEEV
ncbi:MAG: hypothetical protein JXQ23_03500, partial [Clostridia bacterium]|nr:hypothetical protein [Clostridia bacterium]